MKLLIDISKEAYKNLQKRSTEIQAEGFSLENSVLNGTPISNNTTNGDVIKAMFPYIEVENHGLITSIKGLDCDKSALDPYRQFWSEWWNAPYRGEEI